MQLRELLGIKGLLGWCIAGICAVLITSAFVMLYNYSGTHIVNPSGATDYKWLQGQFKGNMTEGINLMHMDANGFNNLSSDTENIDILLMGGSHMEAVQFPTEYNTGTLLNSGIPDKKTYNIGMSGHQLPNCLDNLEAAVNEYAPSEYVVIQTGNVDMSFDILSALTDGTLADIPSYDSGVVYYMQKIPAIKVVYKQLREKLGSDLKSVIKTKAATENGAAFAALDDCPDDNLETAVLKELLTKKSMYCRERGIKLMIAYTPAVEVRGDGRMQRGDSAEITEEFAKACREADIGFIDCYKAFEKNYDENYEVPFGFDNATMGAGHLNMTGHRILAEQIMNVVGGGR